jgi:hypothetical protein
MYHPEGMAALVAVICAPDDVEKIMASERAKAARMTHQQALQRAIDMRRSQVLRLARAYYATNEQDYVEIDWRSGYARNGLQNLARLDRRNLQ